MRTQNILIAGDTSVGDIVELLAPFLDGMAVEERPNGVAFDSGVYTITDAELDGAYYEDDQGLPLSHYRYEVSTRAFDGAEWAERAYEILSNEANLDLLWMEGVQRVVKTRSAH